MAVNVLALAGDDKRPISQLDALELGEDFVEPNH